MQKRKKKKQNTSKYALINYQLIKILKAVDLCNQNEIAKKWNKNMIFKHYLVVVESEKK